ncbi:hypothetical protein ES705_37328 [subsurface metagenome]
MSYDTITAYTMQDRFIPDPASGWKGQAALPGGKEKWWWNLEGLDFTWYSDSGMLMAQVSLPKRLYGQNISELRTGDEIKEAVNLVEVDIRQRLAREIPSLWSWEVFRVDACKNYPLDSEAKVLEILNLLGGRRLPQGKQPPYRGQELSVEWPGKTRRYKAYSKFLETHHDPDAMGILRAEASVQHSYYLRRILKAKKVPLSSVLTLETWAALMGSLPGVVESLLEGVTMDDKELLDLLQEHYGGERVLKLIGFCQLYQRPGGEELLRRIYSRQGYHKLKKLLKDVGIDPGQVKTGGQLPLVKS